MDGLPDYIGSHDLVISYGDCELFGICVCGEWFGSIRPDGRLDNLASKWEHHVMTGGYLSGDAS